MATALTVQQIVRSGNGLTPTYTPADVAGNTVPGNDGRIFLHFKNANAATRTVTINTPGQVAGLDITDLTAIIPVNPGDKMVGPLPPAVFNQADESLSITYSAVADLTVAAIRL